VPTPAASPTPPAPGHPRLRAEALAVVDEALGGRRRRDPVLEGSGGPAGNARLTAWTGLVLLVLIVAELVTLLDVHGLLRWHVVIGVLLIPVALLKTASTGWRILRYYTGSRPYRRAGPPPLALRVLGPLVVGTTLVLLGSGVLLVAVGEERGRATLVTLLGQRIDLLGVHQGLFVVFAVVTGLHVLARLGPALALATVGVRRRTGPAERVPGARRRAVAVAATLAAAGVAAGLLLPLASGWQGAHHDRFGRPPHGVSARR
jgi:hypothetical protein